MRAFSFPVLVTAALLTACGSNTVGGSQSTGSGTGSGSSSGTGSGGSTSSSSSTGGSVRATYPAGPYGVTINSVIQNLTLPGFFSTTDSVQANTLAYDANLDLQTFRTAVDSNGKPYRYLLLDISAGWCPPCNSEAADLGLNGPSAGKVATWLGKGGLVFTVLAESYDESSHAPAVMGDVDRWTNAHSVPFSVGWDANGALEAQGISNSNFPANLIIDLNTMVIVDGWYGDNPDYPRWEAALNAP